MKKYGFLVSLLLFIGIAISQAQELTNIYKKMGVLVRFPSNYTITDESFADGVFVFNCQVKNDDLSCITFSIQEDDSFLFLNEYETKIECEAGINACAEELASIYSNLKRGEIRYDNSNECTRVSQAIKANIFGTSMIGKIYMIVKGNKIMCVLLQAENASYLNELNSIYKALRF